MDNIKPKVYPWAEFSHQLFRQWFEVKFNRIKCKDILVTLMARFNFPMIAFEPNNIIEGKICAQDFFLFDQFQQTEIWNITKDKLNYDISSSALPTLITQITQNNKKTNKNTRYNKKILKQPGLYRRQHASIVIHSEKTSITLDPVYFNPQSELDPIDFNSDAICITHSHADHWHLPSLLKLYMSHTQIIVPEVPKTNLLTDENMASTLKLANLNGEILKWWERKQIGDIEIIALPFYGEQPTVSLPLEIPGLRNWGNCYRFNCPSFSAIVLADSGIDPEGSIIEVLNKNFEDDGPVDYLLSCCYNFPEIINHGLTHYILAVPFDWIEKTYFENLAGKENIITLGIEGLVKACQAIQAKYFLPYANGAIANINSKKNESLVLTQLSAALAFQNAKTKVLDWNMFEQITI